MAQPILVLVISMIFIASSCNHASSFTISTTPTSTTMPSQLYDNVTDWQALLSFKSVVSGGDQGRGPLASWNYSVHFCQWPGITCSGHRHPYRVVAMNLSSFGLNGSISPAIANLTFLRSIDLSHNNLQDIIPKEIGGLFRLQILNLGSNSLGGGIPSSLSRCSKLKLLNLTRNALRGEVPESLGNCSDIQILSMSLNELTRGMPPSMANLSSLRFLDMSENHISGSIPAAFGNLNSLISLGLHMNQIIGDIPPSLGQLHQLEDLLLFENNLTGTIPSSLWNLSSLSILHLSINHLSGQLPEDAGHALPNLRVISLFDNQFHGPIPLSLPNASNLYAIQLDRNMFSGTIPPNLGSLQDLQILIIYSNKLETKGPNGWSFLHNLANCTNLQYLDLSENNFTGILPNSIANLSTVLTWLEMSQNRISGSLSPEIGNLESLTTFNMNNNLLTGPIPKSIATLKILQLLDLDGNKLSGEIPSTIGNLSLLNELYLDNNELVGNIPTSLGNCQSLSFLNIRKNKLTGRIPKEILNISTISIGISLGSNLLTGSIPQEVGNLRNVMTIDFSKNKLSGEIPGAFGQCKALQELYLGGNSFHGEIPPSLSELNGIQVLDISQNNLSGEIPDFLQNFRNLYLLNLSFNNFEGEVPMLGPFKNVSGVSVIGNQKLCGGNPGMHLPSCPSQSQQRRHHSHTLVLVISISCSFLFMFVLLCLLVARYLIQKSKQKPQAAFTIKGNEKISYNDLMGATNGFSSENIIGSGRFSTVYRGILDQYGMGFVAVKVFKLDLRGGTKSFTVECEALRNIRHRNLVKILTSCSSIDFKGNDFKAMVFELMTNNSLDHWLHPDPQQEHQLTRLNIIQRLNIAIDVASALDYLHHQGDTPIIHCDVKPSNILLDNDMVAHLGDFGLAKFFKVNVSSSQYSASTAGLKGTIGYIPPEYGMTTEVSVLGDVYSYGILVFEIFTGKRPTDEIFKDGLTIRKFVELAIPDGVMDIMAANFFLEESGETTPEDAERINQRTKECITSLLRIGTKCSSDVSLERGQIGDVCRELHAIRDAFLANGNQEQQRSVAQIRRPEVQNGVV